MHKQASTCVRECQKLLPKDFLNLLPKDSSNQLWKDSYNLLPKDLGTNETIDKC